jgi:hypothetical protein
MLIRWKCNEFAAGKKVFAYNLEKNSDIAFSVRITIREGHDFSRAANGDEYLAASAAEGCIPGTCTN